MSLTQYRGEYTTFPELKMTTLPLGCVDTIREAEQNTSHMLEEKLKIKDIQNSTFADCFKLV